MKKNTRRGYDEQDRRWFSDNEVIRLQKASEEIEWLLNRDYRLEQVVTFVGDRYQFSVRQREALKRATCSTEQKNSRRIKELSLDEMKNKDVYIDGFNLIITLEVAVSGGTLILGSDGGVRDLAGLRGTYKIIDKTGVALNLIGSFLNEFSPKLVTFYLDAPVSNSRNLSYKILEMSSRWDFETKVELVINPDVLLSKEEGVVTSDASILDQCGSYFNLNRRIIEDCKLNVDLIKITN